MKLNTYKIDHKRYNYLYFGDEFIAYMFDEPTVEKLNNNINWNSSNSIDQTILHLDQVITITLEDEKMHICARKKLENKYFVEEIEFLDKKDIKLFQNKLEQ